MSHESAKIVRRVVEHVLANWYEQPFDLQELHLELLNDGEYLTRDELLYVLWHSGKARRARYGDTWRYTHSLNTPNYPEAIWESTVNPHYVSQGVLSYAEKCGEYR